MDDLDLFAQMLDEARRVVLFTGAGISTESGIPDFRSPGGIWSRFKPVEFQDFVASEDARRDAWRFKMLSDPDMRRAEPNRGHRAVAELVHRGKVSCVITQNIDGLHKKAGSLGVTEIHGSLREIDCLSCGKAYLAPHVPEGDPPYCECGGVLKPNTVLFGEQLPREALETAYRESSTCKTMLVIGTSAVVQPAASLPSLAKQNGAVVIEVNPEKAFGAANYYIAEKAGTALTRIVEEVRGLTSG